MWLNTVDVDLNHLVEVVFVMFFYCKITLPPFHTELFGRKSLSMYNIHLKIEELCSTLWRVGYQHKLLRIFLHGIVVSSCEFIYSVIPGWTHLFYSLGYNPVLIYFVAQIFALLASGTLSVGTCVPLIGFHRFGFFEALNFWHEAHCVYFLRHRGISYFSKEACSFFWTVILETKICAHCY